MGHYRKEMIMLTLGYFAIAILAISHWLQVWKIHKHKEVRDISVWTYVFLLCGYFILATKAYLDYSQGNGDILWFFRQMATIAPVSIVIFQIRFHRKDRWHDDLDPYCAGCGQEMELDWEHCPWCSCSDRHRIKIKS